jgi:hypothetical protein
MKKTTRNKWDKRGSLSGLSLEGMYVYFRQEKTNFPLKAGDLLYVYSALPGEKLECFLLVGHSEFNSEMGQRVTIPRDHAPRPHRPPFPWA